MRLRLGVTATVLALATAGLHSATTAPLRPAAATTTNFPGPTCPDVTLLFARGSGEAPKRSIEPGDYNNTTDWGMGSVGKSLRQNLQGKVEDRGLTFGYEGVIYQALPVPFADKSTWFDPITTDTYEVGVSTGATAVALRVMQLKKKCANEPQGVPSIILGGYSQGAWATRRALNLMDAGDADLTQYVDAVVLFGDPTKRWTEPSVRWRSEEQDPSSQGIALRVGMADGPEDAALPSHLQSRTSNFCIPDDFICGGNRIGPHSDYDGEATRVAANFIDQLLPVGPTNLPTNSELASIYPYLRGGSRDVYHSLGGGEWPSGRPCWDWTDGFTATSGRWASYYTRSGDMPFFEGLEDPGVFVYKFRNARDARTAYNSMASFVDTCSGGTYYFEPGEVDGWTIDKVSTESVGNASVAYSSMDTRYNSDGYYDKDWELQLAVLKGPYLFRIMNQHDWQKPSRSKAVDLARKVLTLLK